MKNKLSTSCLAAMLLLSFLIVFPLPSVLGQPTTYVKVINPLTGDGNFIFYTNCSHIWTDPEMKPATCLGPAIGYEFIANITVENVIDLSSWQLNLTWCDGTGILQLLDLFLPTDHVFAGRPLTYGPKDIQPNWATWSLYIGPPAPPETPSFNGTGRLCQARFNITAKPDCTTPCQKLSCNIKIETNPALVLYTFLLDSNIEEIPFDPVHGYYEIHYKVPPVIIPKPYLEAIDPLDGDHLIVKGEPLGPPILGTPAASFDVQILAKGHHNLSNIIGIQTCAISFPNYLFNVSGLTPDDWVTPGDFYNNPAWAPYGVYWMPPILDLDTPSPDYCTLYLCLIINPNPTTGEWDWGVFPHGEGLFATIHLEVLRQEEFPWEMTGDLDLSEVFVNEMFLNTTLEFIPHDPPIDAEVKVVGYVVGRMIDVYVGADCTPYPAPYGGQGINRSADMFWPQKKICIWANVTYNMWPEQNKVVAFEIRDPDWNIVTVLSGVTNENGVAYASFRIPWPEHENYLGRNYTIIASVDIACEKVWDWLWFHFDYLTRWEKVTVTPEQVGHCEYIEINVTLKSKAMQKYMVLITIDLKDELQYPIGFDMVWVEIGGAEWCTYENYNVTFRFHIHKHAHAGVATIHVNSLSALPSLCGYPWCPEYIDPQTGKTPTFVILAR